MIKELKLRFVYMLVHLCEKTPSLRDISKINSSKKINSEFESFQLQSYVKCMGNNAICSTFTQNVCELYRQQTKSII